MSEIKPVACLRKAALKNVGCGIEVYLDPPDIADDDDVMIYDQQAIDTLRAEVGELNEAFNILGVLANEQEKRAERAEAEVEVMRSSVLHLVADMRRSGDNDMGAAIQGWADGLEIAATKEQG